MLKYCSGKLRLTAGGRSLRRKWRDGRRAFVCNQLKLLSLLALTFAYRKLATGFIGSTSTVAGRPRNSVSMARSFSFLQNFCLLSCLSPYPDAESAAATTTAHRSSERSLARSNYGARCDAPLMIVVVTTRAQFFRLLCSMS